MDEISIKLSESDLKKTLNVMISGSNLNSMAELGRELGYKETTFRSAVNKNSLRYKDFVKAANIMGYEIIIKSKS